MSYRDADKDALIAKLQKENQELKKILNNKIELCRHIHIGTKLCGDKIDYEFSVLRSDRTEAEKKTYTWNKEHAPHKQCGITYRAILIPEDDYDNFLKLTK